MTTDVSDAARIGIGIVVGFLALVIGGSLVDLSKHDDQPASVSALPDYRLETGAKPSTLEVYVDQSYPPAELARIIEDLQRKYSDREDGYFVQINCDAGNTTTHNNNRLATAKFAVGKLGAARTGLDVGEHEITEVLGAKCPPDLPTSTVSGPSAQDVIDAVVAAGLPATDPRDNSAGICSNAGCVQLITTDEFSVYQFPDLASVERWASTYPSRYVHGTIMLRFTESGSAPTDPALIPQYDAVLDQLMAAGG